MSFQSAGSLFAGSGLRFCWPIQPRVRASHWSKQRQLSHSSLVFDCERSLTLHRHRIPRLGSLPIARTGQRWRFKADLEIPRLPTMQVLLVAIVIRWPFRSNVNEGLQPQDPHPCKRRT